MNTSWCVNTVTLDVSFVSKCFILIECKGERWLVGEADTIWQQLLLERFQVCLHPHPSFSLTLYCPGLSMDGLFFFFFLRRIKQVTKGNWLKKKKENKKMKEKPYTRSTNSLVSVSLGVRLPIVTGVSHPFFSQILGSPEHQDVSGPLLIQAVCRVSGSNTEGSCLVRPGEAGFEHCL